MKTAKPSAPETTLELISRQQDLLARQMGMIGQQTQTQPRRSPATRPDRSLPAVSKDEEVFSKSWMMKFLNAQQDQYFAGLREREKVAYDLMDENAKLRCEIKALQIETEALVEIAREAQEDAQAAYECNEGWEEWARMRGITGRPRHVEPGRSEQAAPRQRRAALRVCNHLALVPSGQVSIEVANQ